MTAAFYRTDDLRIKWTKVVLPPVFLEEELPATEKVSSTIYHARNQICDILAGKDHRLLVVAGPASEKLLRNFNHEFAREGENQESIVAPMLGQMLVVGHGIDEPQYVANRPPVSPLSGRSLLSLFGVAGGQWGNGLIGFFSLTC